MRVPPTVWSGLTLASLVTAQVLFDVMNVGETPDIIGENRAPWAVLIHDLMHRFTLLFAAAFAWSLVDHHVLYRWLNMRAVWEMCQGYPDVRKAFILGYFVLAAGVFIGFMVG